jgi:hypothetical protein
VTSQCVCHIERHAEQGPYTFAPNHTKTPDNTWLMEREYG